MRADICDTSDEKAIYKFRDILQNMGAKLEDKTWAAGVDIYHVIIGDQRLTIFNDSWSLDIDGPEDLVSRILGDFKRPTA